MTFNRPPGRFFYCPRFRNALYCLRFILKGIAVIKYLSAAVILIGVVFSATVSGCRPKAVSKPDTPAASDSGDAKDPSTPEPTVPPVDPAPPSPSSEPDPDPLPPSPAPEPSPTPAPPSDSGPDTTPSADPSEPNWDSATHAEISAGEFIYDPDAKIWVCYSSDTPEIAWKIEGTGKYPVPKELDAAAICSCCGYHGVKLILMTPKEWENPSASQEKGRTAKRAVVMPTGDTKFDGPGCGGTCSCRDEEKK